MSKGHNFLSLVNVQSLGHTRIYTLLLLPTRAVFFTSTRQGKDKCFGPCFIHVTKYKLSWLPFILLSIPKPYSRIEDIIQNSNKIKYFGIDINFDFKL